jgi:hypothetical protein
MKTNKTMPKEPNIYKKMETNNTMPKVLHVYVCKNKNGNLMMPKASNK